MYCIPESDQTDSNRTKWVFPPLSQIPLSSLMGLAQGFSLVYSCATTCPASPNPLTVGESVLSILTSRIPPFIFPVIGHLPVLELKSLGSVPPFLDHPPKQCRSPINMSSASISETGHRVPPIQASGSSWPYKSRLPLLPQTSLY